MKLWDNDGQCSLIFFPYHSVDFRLFQNPRINNEVGLSFFHKNPSASLRPRTGREDEGTLDLV